MGAVTERVGDIDQFDQTSQTGHDSLFFGGTMSRTAASTGHNPSADMPTIAASEAKKGFAQLMRRVEHGNEPVLITRNSHPTAVMLSLQAYQELVEASPDPLASLRSQFDRQLAAMQTADAKAGVDALFAATPDELGRAATTRHKNPG